MANYLWGVLSGASLVAVWWLSVPVWVSMMALSVFPSWARKNVRIPRLLFRELCCLLLAAFSAWCVMYKHKLGQLSAPGVLTGFGVMYVLWLACQIQTSRRGKLLKNAEKE